MSVFVSILAGCGGGGGGHWNEPKDTARPTVTATVPATTIPGPTLGVPTNTTITVAFNENMSPATITAPGAFTVTGPGATPVTGAVPAVTYDVASRTATFHPLAALTGGVTYTVTIKGTGVNAVTDVAVPGNALAGNPALPLVANDYVWRFTTSFTPDTFRPTVTATVPATTVPGPTLGVPTNTAITVAFNEDMAPATITAPGAITVTGPGATPVTGAVPAVTYDVASRTATFHPLAALTGGVTYTVTIKGTGVNAVTDVAVPGNALAGNPALPLVANDYVWSFTTSSTPDTTRPTVTATVPATTVPGPTLGVPTNTAITVAFSEDMSPATITAPGAIAVTGPGATPVTGAVPAVTYDVASRTATFHPAAALSGGVTYTVTIKGTGANAVTDLAVPGNALAGNPALPLVANDYVWSFTTVGTIPPPPSTQLGSAASYGIMATSAITNTGASTRINGDVALEPGASNGLLPVQVNGTININNAASNQAFADLLVAYNFYKNLAPGFTVPGGFNLGAFVPVAGDTPGVLRPGTYTSDSAMNIDTHLILDGGGNSNAVWVFQIGSSLTTTAPLGNVELRNGAQARNVFWVPTASATIGVNTTFYGTVIAGVSITGETGAVINGRLLSGAIGAGTIALDTNTVNVPAP